MRAHGRLVAVAHRELREAFAYVLALPPTERGLRLFFLWPLFLAVMTLRKLYGNAAVLGKEPVKVSRKTVKWVLGTTRMLVGQDWALRWLFSVLTAPLPRDEDEDPRFPTVQVPSPSEGGV
jgi:farnesyl-diphosphate farnesyltransferase